MIRARFVRGLIAITIAVGIPAGCTTRREASKWSLVHTPKPHSLALAAAKDTALASCVARVVSDAAMRTAFGWTPDHAAIRSDPTTAIRFAELARMHHDLLETVAGRTTEPNPVLVPLLDDRIARLNASLDHTARANPDLEWHWIVRFLAALDRLDRPCRR